MSKILINRALLEQALEALQNAGPVGVSGSRDAQLFGAMDAIRAALEPPEVYIPKEFNNWWDAWEHAKDNPYYLDSPKYWAWEGWKARAALEQEEQEEQDQPDINWLKARPGIEQFIAGVGYDMTLTHENVVFKSREKVDVRQEEPVVVRAEALDLILEAAEVLDKVRVSCDAWEKYGLRDFLPDELTGTAGMLRDGSALTHPPRRAWVSLTEEEIKNAVLGDLFGGSALMSMMRDGVMVAELRQAVERIARAIEAKLKEKNRE